MTYNQIARFNAQENQRHNLVMEAETGRHNLAEEDLKSQANSINEVHFSRQDAASLLHAEAAITSNYINDAHYQRADAISLQRANEEIRHNQATESIGNMQATASLMQAGAAQVNAQANVMSARAAMQNAASNALNAQSNLRNANTNAYNATLRASELSELERHNKEMESHDALRNVVSAGNLNTTQGFNAAQISNWEAINDINQERNTINSFQTSWNTLKDINQMFRDASGWGQAETVLDMGNDASRIINNLN